MKNLFSKNTLLTILLVLIWGAVWPINKLAIVHISPLLFAGIRTFLSGILLTIILYRIRHLLQWKKHWKAYTVSAFYNTILFFGLHSFGLIFLPSGLFSVLIYVQPIVLSVFAWLVLNEHFSGLKLLGLVLGFIGIIIASIDGITTHISIIGVSLALLTGISWAFGVLYVKKVSTKVNPYWIVVMQNVIGGGVLLLLGTIFEDWQNIVWNVPVSIAIAYGAVFGVPIAYLIYYYLINSGEASKVSVSTFLVPITSVLLSVLFLNEDLTYRLFLGMILVGISIILVNLNLENIIRRKKSS